MRSVVSTWWIAMTMAGCAQEPMEDARGTVFEQKTETEDDCEGSPCPTNSPVVATFPFHELITHRGVPSAQGFAIETFKVGNPGFDFRVVNGRIRAERPNKIVEGADLVGAELWLQHSSGRYALRITAVMKVNMWARLDPNEPAPQIEVYRLEWGMLNGNQSPDGGILRNICADAMLPPDSIELQEPAYPNGSTMSSASSAPPPPTGAFVPNFVSFVFEGEKIFANTLQVIPAVPAVVNVGCAGHLLSKMYLMGHVAAAASMGYVTPVLERQALMKMFAADYCGIGHPFTVPGVRLQWQDHRRWFKYRPSPAPVSFDVESKWGPGGATCLSIPRVAANPTDASNQRFESGVFAEIQAHCSWLLNPAKRCNQNAEFFAADHLIAVNPGP